MLWDGQLETVSEYKPVSLRTMADYSQPHSLWCFHISLMRLTKRCFTFLELSMLSVFLLVCLRLQFRSIMWLRTNMKQFGHYIQNPTNERLKRWIFCLLLTHLGPGLLKRNSKSLRRSATQQVWMPAPIRSSVISRRKLHTQRGMFKTIRCEKNYCSSRGKILLKMFDTSFHKFLFVSSRPTTMKWWHRAKLAEERSLVFGLNNFIYSRTNTIIVLISFENLYWIVLLFVVCSIYSTLPEYTCFR